MNNTKKILIVDDEENIRRIFKKALEKKNYTVHTAPNAEDALQKIKNQKYSLIFSDIFMDGMSGLALLKEVKKINPQTRVVVMTAQDTMNNTIEAMRIGAYDYISKPFDFENILYYLTFPHNRFNRILIYFSFYFGLRWDLGFSV